MPLLIIWILLGVVAGMIGAKKGEGCGGFLLGFLLGPFGIIIAILSKGNRIQCPACKEYINKEALICKHCRSSVTSGQSSQNPFQSNPESTSLQSLRHEGDPLLDVLKIVFISVILGGIGLLIWTQVLGNTISWSK